MAKISKPPKDKEKFKRKHKQSFCLNEFEMQAFEKYCKKYKIKNRAKFLRETVMIAILKKFDEDYPTLFDLPEAKS